MKTVHLVYPHGPRIATPDAIGRHLGHRLEAHYRVRYYDWDEPTAIRPAPGDILLGHVHPFPLTCFRRSLDQTGWHKILILQPYNHGDDFQVAFLDEVIDRADRFLAITGNYWFRRVADSSFAHWLPKMIHLDLAVDREEFPPIKTAFNPPGQRKFLYIGHNLYCKNPEYLVAIARHMPETHFGWMGSGTRSLPGFVPLGPQDFSTPAALMLLSEYDFLITVGFADANPTTILEAMAWGLIPVCTPQSGYEDYPGIVNVPLDDVPAVVAVLRRLQSATEAELFRFQAQNWDALTQHFNWDRFADQVRAAIEEEVRPEVARTPWMQRLRLRGLAWASPYAPWRPRILWRVLRRAVKR